MRLGPLGGEHGGKGEQAAIDSDGVGGSAEGLWRRRAREASGRQRAGMGRWDAGPGGGELGIEGTAEGTPGRRARVRGEGEFRPRRFVAATVARTGVWRGRAPSNQSRRTMVTVELERGDSLDKGHGVLPGVE